MKSNKKNKSTRTLLGSYGTPEGGFTLMEVIVAVAVITTAIVGAMALVSFSVSSISLNKSKITATNLAQEGLEIVRNIRDSNWLADKKTPDTWQDGLGAGNYRAQYNQLGLLSFSSTPLKINSNGFYQYSSGTNTSFYRKIIISHISDSQIKVVSEVTWQEKSRSQVVAVEDRLYNWLEQEEEE
jgi:prepilin-type N-terminal cleavage/methylation domain-containing protein